ncbi:hypothetical protein AMES_5838 [Amycolatopsis mediterranei S699]|uniref:Uncharacterized protein n=2 Tax=Amycolatopsis mediterranei TaxID=33910 RepID=A0A0H3DC75_AMYMU|nr:hypothetical protein [Amycolatopsis mediterranei]ADJ47663.1 hypothetical protein AMED_5920 [Amycolatopsis mediterranei U32]AEK44548.1 hypothetical protein RAM_30365 [Amycolatopsis mediterranei S699]AFO79374.1 hypothetical protein AMES_5838 [Amycolatopsis mediterranei S699]AGT86502.1 hypothetical protein B737_5838 [Amycolatopsis mediterranei RB]KDO11842.1 hypothetical protein DV26_05255 [Amycolatopsis mediterranei]
MSAGAYHAETAEMGTIAHAVEDVGSSFLSATRDLEGLVLDALSFAGIGSGVAAANSALHSTLGSALQKLLHLLTNVNQNVRTAADGYRAADSDVAQAYGGGQSGGGAAAAAAPQQLDPRVVDSIMRSEGATGEQGGVPEAYGFRQNMHNGYDRIIAAREEYGIGSAEERAVVADLMTANARTAGALNFTDPGTQAAIMSGAHMRGAGGVRAILNHMAGEDIVRSSRTLGDATIQHVQGLTPEQFQQEFRDARVEYDRQIYGGTNTTQGGHTQNWWDRYGTGLTRRYDREQAEFLGLSQPQH